MRILFLLGVTVVALASGCSHDQKKKETGQAYLYHRPLSSPGTKFGGLPPAVQHTVRAQAGAADIYDVSKEGTPDRVVYKIRFMNPKVFPPLYVASDGSVLYPDMTTVAVYNDSGNFGATSGGPANGVKFSDLPVKVANTVLEMAPTAEVSFISKLIAGDNVTYEVSFKDSKQPSLLISESGRVLDRRPVAAKELPY